ncbi:MAG: hypothetical protein IKV16_06665 [Clostridia bacterium]|nr:hypothetical protein [Clostridia bacterium]
MQENRSTSFHAPTNCQSGQGTVCIDTKRILDCCRDRDCFEDTRVYLGACGEEILANATNVRTRSANLLCAYVGVEEVPFNCGFYRVDVRYYIELEFEACLGVGRSQSFKGVCALEKDVILYGGEGKAVSFSSDSSAGYCAPCCPGGGTTNAPVAVVETVEPIVLGTKVVECGCPCPCPCGENADIPEGVRTSIGEALVFDSQAPRLYVSFGVFSVIRIERPAQLLVQATDYSVPDKECTRGTNDSNPCELFRTIAFPVAQFRATECCQNDTANTSGNSGGCGCHGKK